MSHRVSIPSLLALLFAAACGGGVNVVPGGAGAGGGGAGGGGAGGAGGLAACPASEPDPGDPCGEEGRHCTYGDAPRPECRTQLLCSKGQWVGTLADCVEPPPGSCDLPPSPSGVTCAKEGLVCVDDQSTICVCSSCSGGPCSPPPPHWQCAAPPGEGCPAVAPNDGTACGASGLSCTYGLPCGPSGVTVDCKAGTWLWKQDVVCAL
jgi:hypothetical protein